MSAALPLREAFNSNSPGTCIGRGPQTGSTSQNRKTRTHAGPKRRGDVKTVLVPDLKPGDVVILDNLGSHKGRAARAAIRAAGAHLLILPPYTLCAVAPKVLTLAGLMSANYNISTWLRDAMLLPHLTGLQEDLAAGQRDANSTCAGRTYMGSR